MNRPKRKKSKDNPYTLLVINNKSGYGKEYKVTAVGNHIISNSKYMNNPIQ